MEFFVKIPSFKYFGYSDKYFGYCDASGYSVTENDILTGINIYSGDNSFSLGIILLRYFTVDIQIFWYVTVAKRGYNNCYKIAKIYTDKVSEGLLLTLNNLDCSNLTSNILTLPKFHLILYTFALYKLIAISVYSSNNSSLISYSFFAHQVLASRTYATLFARFSKANLQS